MYKVEKSALGSWVPDVYVISAKAVQKLHFKHTVRFIIMKNEEIQEQLNIFHMGFGFMMELFFMFPYHETPKKEAQLIIYVQ